MTKLIETLSPESMQVLLSSLVQLLPPQAQDIIAAPVDGNGTVQVASVLPANPLQQAAIGQIESLSHKGAVSRAAEIANLSTALGTDPSDALKRDCQLRWITGQLPVDLADAAKPDAWFQIVDGARVGPCIATDAMQLDWARSQVFDHVAPPSGKKASKLKAGKLGYRSEAVQRVIRNAEQRYSLLLAETGYGTAMTIAERDAAERKAKEAAALEAASRAPQMAGSSQTSESEIVPPLPDGVEGETAREWTADDLCQHVSTQSASLLALANAQAKLMPTDMGMAIQSFRTATLAAMNAQQERNAKRDALAAENDSRDTTAPGNMIVGGSASSVTKRPRRAKLKD